MLINADETTSELAAAVAHEIRHVVLGDFGRSGVKGLHDSPGVNAATQNAEEEDRHNVSQR